MYISGIIDKLEKQHRIVAILAHSEIHCQQAQRIAQAVFVQWACLRQFYHITPLYSVLDRKNVHIDPDPDP